MTVNAQDSRGATVSGIATTTTADFEVVESGSLTVALGGNTPEATLIPSIATEQEIAQIKLTAINDSINLTEINFVNTSSSTAAMATDTADSLISEISLYDGTALIDSTTLVAGAGTFMTENKVIVPANGTKTLSVKVKLNNIVNDATATNKDIRFAITTVDSKSSAGTLTADQAAVTIANNIRVRKTIPTVTLMALPETLLTAGDHVVSKFKVTADANGDVELNKVVLTTTLGGAATVAATTSNAVKINGSSKAISSYYAGGLLTVTFTTTETISAGTSKEFEILTTITGGVDGDSVTTKIVEDTSYGTTGSFEWSDGADILSQTVSNGHRVKGLTTSTQTISK
jgi:hypothetical protein